MNPYKLIYVNSIDSSWGSILFSVFGPVWTWGIPPNFPSSSLLVTFLKWPSHKMMTRNKKCCLGVTTSSPWWNKNGMTIKAKVKIPHFWPGQWWVYDFFKHKNHHFLSYTFSFAAVVAVATDLFFCCCLEQRGPQSSRFDSRPSR